MPKSTPVIFQKTLVAAAILSLSACSSMPKVPELDAVGDGVVRAGKATADLSRKTWNTTTYLLGFSDSKDGDDSPPSDDQLLVASDDSLNQELQLADAPTIETPQVSAPAIDASAADRPILVEQATAVTAQPESAPATEIASTEDVIEAEVIEAEEDLIHEVSSSETLWDIAKTTTGDANNWHVIADVNNLTQNATVFPGQQLLIPADLIKPDFDTPAASAESSGIAVNTQDLTAGTTDQSLAAASPQLETPAQRDESINVDVLAEATPQVVDKAAEFASLSANAAAFDLNDGETLWDFAKRTTGDATNWQTIADHNNFTERQAVTVRPGQTIFVPLAIVRDEEKNTATAPSAVTEELPVQSAAASSTTDAVEQQQSATVTAGSETDDPLFVPQKAVAASVTVTEEVLETETDKPAESLATETSALDESEPLTIVEATYKAEDLLDPANVSDESPTMAENDNIPASIMVSGTYYPKAVYNDADFSSSLLMRVSPGTELQVSRAIGTWFEVETEQGVGYVHQRDIQ